MRSAIARSSGRRSRDTRPNTCPMTSPTLGSRVESEVAITAFDSARAAGARGDGVTRASGTIAGPPLSKGASHVEDRLAHRRPRRVAGACGRDLHVALHAQDHRAGGLRLRLDRRHGRRRRRLRQARDGRGAARLAELRQGRVLGFRRRAPRGAPRRLHRRPPLSLGRRARHEHDLGLRRRERPGASEDREDHLHVRAGLGRRGRHAHLLRAAGRMLITGLSNAKDLGGKTALVEYANDGGFVRTIWLPDDAPYGYDARVQPRLNRMLTSSFTGKKNYMRDLGELMGDAEAMKAFGNTAVVWDFHARKPLQTLAMPGAPLEIRWALQPRHDWAITGAALTSKLWLVEQA